jgi:hypothetical protein
MEFKKQKTRLERERDNRVIISSLSSLMDRTFSIYPNLTASQHISSVMRSKGATDKNPKHSDAKFEDPYHWSNEKLLSKWEKYYEELEKDPPQLWNEEEDDFDTYYMDSYGK